MLERVKRSRLRTVVGTVVKSGIFISCVHYVSIKSCPYLSRVNIATIDRTQKIQECTLNGLNSQLNDRMISLPVNSRLYRMPKISFLKIFIAPEDSP